MNHLKTTVVVDKTIISNLTMWTMKFAWLQQFGLRHHANNSRSHRMPKTQKYGFESLSWLIEFVPDPCRRRSFRECWRRRAWLPKRWFPSAGRPETSANVDCWGIGPASLEGRRRPEACCYAPRPENVEENLELLLASFFYVFCTIKYQLCKLIKV